MGPNRTTLGKRQLCCVCPLKGDGNTLQNRFIEILSRLGPQHATKPPIIELARSHMHQGRTTFFRQTAPLQKLCIASLKPQPVIQDSQHNDSGQKSK